MASIYGVSLVGATSYMGREGYALISDIKIDGKKVLSYRDDAHGGQSDLDPFDFSDPNRSNHYNALDERRIKFFSNYGAMTHQGRVIYDVYSGKPEDYSKTPIEIVCSTDTDAFIWALYELKEHKKVFNKALKKGYAGFAQFSVEGCTKETKHKNILIEYYLASKLAPLSNKEIEDYFTTSLKEKYGAEKVVLYRVFRKKEDFDIK